jgi:hypothetical protein
MCPHADTAESNTKKGAIATRARRILASATGAYSCFVLMLRTHAFCFSYKKGLTCLQKPKTCDYDARGTHALLDKYVQVKHVHVAGHESGALFAGSDNRQ